jgi:hypothetical protein
MQVGEWLRPSCPHLRQAVVFDPSCRNPLDKACRQRQVVSMKHNNLPGLTPAWIIVLATMVAAFLPIGVAYIFKNDIRPADWIGFAGSIVTAGVALWAAMMAWNAVQQQIKVATDQFRASERLREEERINQSISDIRALNRARNYLTTFAKHFPAPNSVRFNGYDFGRKLWELNKSARVYISESASNAPGDFGARIRTEMWRMRTLAENVGSPQESEDMDYFNLSGEIRACLEEILRIIDDLKDELDRREHQLANQKAFYAQ